MILKKITSAGINWTRSNKTNGYETNGYWDSLCVTPTGRVIAGSAGDAGIWYSDDNGINWTESNETNGYWYSLCVTPTGRIIAGSAGGKGIWYSDPECTAVCTKYLDQNGAQEIVTQFKAYCDSLVGGV